MNEAIANVPTPILVVLAIALAIKAVGPEIRAWVSLLRLKRP